MTRYPNTERVTKLLDEFQLKDVYLGSQGFHVFPPEKLQKAQLGYASHPNGSDLTGRDEGDWRTEWIVIGYDADLGDPYFVDTSVEPLPVFTAMHGTGSWDPSEVSCSLSSFLRGLEHLKRHAPQSHSCIAPNDASLTDRRQIRELEEHLTELNGKRRFWPDFFARYVEWLEEHGK